MTFQRLPERKVSTVHRELSGQNQSKPMGRSRTLKRTGTCQQLYEKKGVKIKCTRYSHLIGIWDGFWCQNTSFWCGFGRQNKLNVPKNYVLETVSSRWVMQRPAGCSGVAARRQFSLRTSRWQALTLIASVDTCDPPHCRRSITFLSGKHCPLTQRC